MATTAVDAESAVGSSRRCSALGAVSWRIQTAESYWLRPTTPTMRAPDRPDSDLHVHLDYRHARRSRGPGAPAKRSRCWGYG